MIPAIHAATGCVCPPSRVSRVPRIVDPVNLAVAMVFVNRKKIAQVAQSTAANVLPETAVVLQRTRRGAVDVRAKNVSAKWILSAVTPRGTESA